MHFHTITQDINNLIKYHPRSPEHKFKSNNGLKLHKRTMRRKPFKREKRLILDEFCNI